MSSGQIVWEKTGRILNYDGIEFIEYRSSHRLRDYFYAGNIDDVNFKFRIMHYQLDDVSDQERSDIISNIKSRFHNTHIIPGQTS